MEVAAAHHRKSMSVEVALQKRKARFVGETGLFPIDQVADDDLQAISMDAEVVGELSSDKNLKALRYLWALVTVVANNSEMFLDKDDAMEQLKIQARHAKWVVDPETKKLERRAKSLKRLSDQALQRLIKRFKFIITTQVMPGIDDAALEAQIQEMMQ